MSRYYPYRPAVSVRNGASGEALIETIKLRRVKGKSKTDSLIEKKRERKDKRKERKLKEEKPYDFCDGKVKKLQDEKNRGILVGYLSKGSDDEQAERLEKSDLTDEHDEPVCYLSDGTQSSNKRKRQPSPHIAPSITVHKNIIRIRLSSRKHSETDASLSKGQSCSILGRATNSLVHPKEILQVPDGKQCHITNNNVDEKGIRDFVGKESIAQLGGKTDINGNTFHENKVQSTESFYKSMIEDWVPPSFQFELNEVDDQEWLFGARQQQQEFKRLKVGSDISCSQNSSTSWLCAHPLPDADIYALPYTVPF